MPYRLLPPKYAKLSVVAACPTITRHKLAAVFVSCVAALVNVHILAAVVFSSKASLSVDVGCHDVTHTNRHGQPPSLHPQISLFLPQP